MNEDKSARYHRLKRRADLFGTALSAAFLLWLLISGIALYVREASSFLGGFTPGYEEVSTAAVFAILLSLALQLLTLPFSYYQGYRLEHEYGLSNQTLRLWAKDQAKAAVLGSVLSALGASIVYAALRESPTWWWVISAAVLSVILVGIVQLAPVVLLPLFYTFKPLDRPALVDRLLALASRARTHIVGVYEWALSAHTKKANAALAGLGRTRRILLADTLLADYSDDEIEVILAHELSHHVNHDLWRGVALQTLLLFVSFYVAHLLLTALGNSLALRGLDDPAGMPLLLLVAGACSLIFMPVANALSRAHERRADRFALDMTNRSAAFISAMKRLSQQNLAEERPSPLVRWLFYSHPPIRERIEFARRWEEEKA